jgi:transcriptional regulator with XRE-family HTH domain
MHPVVIGILYSIGMATSRYVITDEQKKALGRAIHEAMKLRGVNQVELAEALGTTQSVISQWRLGKFLAPPRAVFALEEALQVPPGWLSQHFDFMPMPSNMGSGATEIETCVLGDPDLGDGEKAAVLAMIEQFRELRHALEEAQANDAAPARARKAAAKAAAKPASKPRAKAPAPRKTSTKAPRRRATKSVDPAVEAHA